jgi:hypothetical protein
MDPRIDRRLRAAASRSPGRLAALATCAVLLAGPIGAGAVPATASTTGLIRSQTVASAAAGAGWTSMNWSGYAITAGPYTRATSTWKVPTVAPSATPTYSSSWVGIDGFDNSSLIQVGTEQDYTGGSAHYSAWWEILPAAGTTITTLAIHPGDTMVATISRNSTGARWTISLADRTTGRTFSTVRTYSGPGASAEWIQEAPRVGTRIATLARTSLTTFVGTANGSYLRLSAANRGTMIQNGMPVSTPTTQDRRTHAFSVRYTN